MIDDRRTIGLPSERPIRPPSGLLAAMSGGDGRAGDEGSAEGRDSAQPAAPLRVMIVEDEAILSLALESMVEDLGHEVVGTVSRGAQAIVTAGRLVPDVILMDIKLADDVDGVTAAETILSARAVPVVFISAYCDPSFANRTRRLGSELLSKPVARNRLKQVLTAIAGRAG